MISDKEKFFELLKKTAFQPFYRFSIDESAVYEEHKNIFFQAFGLNKGTIHWLFIDALESLTRYNFLSSTGCFLTAIESSIRSILAAKEKGVFKEWVKNAHTLPQGDAMITSIARVNLDELKLLEDCYHRQPNLGIPLLKKAYQHGLPLQELSLPGEDILNLILNNKKPIIVDYRNLISHGNLAIFAKRLYIDPITGEYTENVNGAPQDAIFTPDCLREVSLNLAEISYNWAVSLLEYYKKHNKHLDKK